ncbi:hypothetical protein EMMF5_001647 [Cystobasidiomycetes sp. EMM_F5]
MSEEVPTIAQDTQEVYLHVATKMVQATALIAPPTIALRQLYRRNFSPNRWLRSSALWTFGFGIPAGLAMTWARLRNQEDIAIFDRAYRIRNNVTQVRVDDYSKVGALLGALITTTIFLKRASLPYTILGGASLGIAGGTVTHVVRMAQEEGAKATAKKQADALPDPTKLAEGVAKG